MCTWEAEAIPCEGLGLGSREVRAQRGYGVKVTSDELAGAVPMESQLVAFSEGVALVASCLMGLWSQQRMRKG